MRKTLLYADDDANDIALVQISLSERRDLDLQFARDGVEAIDYLAGRQPFADREVYPLPALILLDVKMPRLSGFDVLSWIRQKSPLDGTPVVMLSSSDHQSDINHAYLLGANAYVVKPAAFSQLQLAILHTVDFFLVHSLNPFGFPSGLIAPGVEAAAPGFSESGAGHG